MASSLPQWSLSWSQNGRSETQIRQSKNLQATIDLHGYTKENAIRKLTDFMEAAASSSVNNSNKHKPWVCVVTGKGSHSGATGGPVLKSAVHKLLVKRNMEYYYSKQKGLFYVNVHSGHILKQNPTLREQHLAATATAAATGGGNHYYNSGDDYYLLHQEDTKVRLLPRNPSPLIAADGGGGGSAAAASAAILLPQNYNQRKKKYDPHQQHPYAHAAATTTNATIASGRRGGSSNHLGRQTTLPINIGASNNSHKHNTENNFVSPLPSEIAADDNLVRQAKSQSLEETRMWKSQRDKDQHVLHKVLQQTKEQAKAEQEQEEELLTQAMILSEQQQQQQHQTLLLEQEEAAELERILQLSLQEAPTRSLPTSSSLVDQDEEDKIMQQVLSQSKLEHKTQQQQEEDELERVLQLSLAAALKQKRQPAPKLGNEEDQSLQQHHHQDEDELQRVLRLSMVETPQSVTSRVPSQCDGWPNKVNEENDLKRNNKIIKNTQDLLLDLQDEEELLVKQLQKPPVSKPVDNPTTISSTLPVAEDLLQSILCRNNNNTTPSPSLSSTQPSSSRPTAQQLSPSLTSVAQFAPQKHQQGDNKATTIPGPDFPSPVMEHRMMEILQRPMMPTSSTLLFSSSSSSNNNLPQGETTGNRNFSSDEPLNIR